tara:strand:- start:8611 stop:9675 length:1065 start_codon:yes stop_codon:yes gene_type:complete
MKKFKNKLTVKGSRSLLKAFAEELDKLGYQKDRMSGDIDWILGPNSILCNYDTARYGFHNHDSISELRIYVKLPQDWDRGLKLAAEIEEEVPEYVESLSTYHDQFTKGKVYKVDKERVSTNNYSVFTDDRGRHNSWGKTMFKPSTKETYDAQELAKPQVGKWYKSKNLICILVYCKELANDGGIFGYGIDGEGNWSDNRFSWFGSDFSKYAVLATDKEVESRLIEYAKKHYPIDTHFKSAHNDSPDAISNGEFIMIECNKFTIHQSGKTINDHYRFVYFEGKWAEILPNEVKVNGYVVTKLNDTTVKVGCKQFQIFALDNISNFIAMYGGTYDIDNVSWTAIDISKVISEFNKM